MRSLHEKYVINKKGKRMAIMLPYSEWQKVLNILEEYDDICAYDEAKAKPSDAIPFSKILKKF